MDGQMDVGHAKLNWMGMEVPMADTYKLAGLVVTGDVLKLVGAIDEFKGAWKAIGRIAPERFPLCVVLPPSKAQHRPPASKARS